MYMYVLVDTNQRLLSNLMRGNCPLLENVLFPTHLTEQPEFCRQTMLVSQRKQQKTTKLLSQKYFHPNTSQAESSNFKSFQFRHYFEVGNYDFDSSLSSSQAPTFLEAVEEADTNMNLSTNMAANGASFLPYTPAVQFTPNFKGCNAVNFHFHYHPHQKLSLVVDISVWNMSQSSNMN